MPIWVLSKRGQICLLWFGPISIFSLLIFSSIGWTSDFQSSALWTELLMFRHYQPRLFFLDSFDPQLVDSRFFLSSNPLRKIITVVVVVVVAAVIMVIITRKIKSNLLQTLWWKSRPVLPKKEKLNCQIFIFHAFQKAKSNFLKTRQSCQRITLKLKRRKCLLPLFSYLVGPASSRRNRLQDSIEMLKTTWCWKAKKNWGMTVGWFSRTPTDLQ